MENYIFLFQNIFFLNCMKLFECIRNSVFFYFILWFFMFFFLFHWKTMFSQVQEKWTCTHMACTNHMETGKKTTYKSHQKFIWQNCSTAETSFSAKQETPACFLCFAMQSGNNSQKSQTQMHKHKCTTKHKKLPEFAQKYNKCTYGFLLNFIFMISCWISQHFLALSKENHWNSRFQNDPILISQPKRSTTRCHIDKNLWNFKKKSTLNPNSLKFWISTYLKRSFNSLFFWSFFST